MRGGHEWLVLQLLRRGADGHALWLELPVGDQLVRQEPTRITRLLILLVKDDPLSLISGMRADGTILPLALALRAIIVDFQLKARRVTIEQFHR